MDEQLPQQPQAPIDSAGPSQVSEPKHFLNKKFAITLVILLLLGGGTYAGIWYWQNGQKINDMADWQTYSNDQLGFSIEYPNNWRQEECTEGFYGIVGFGDKDELLLCGSDAPAMSYINISVMEYDKSQYDLLLKGIEDSLDNLQMRSLTLAGETAKEFSGKIKDIDGYSMPAGTEVAHTVIVRDKVYLVSFGNYDGKGDIKVYNQILPTFKFTDSVGQFCGGIAGVMCSSGYTCKMDGGYPDAGGTCIKNTVACTQEAKQCPDGSYVGRTGPNCEFTACPGDGTLTGHVTIGPNCPVEQAGNPCTPSPQAYTSRQVMVYKADGTTLMTTQNFDTKGDYNITLPAETYIVKSKTGIGSVAQVVGTVTIKSGQTSTLNFSIDTGIR